MTSVVPFMEQANKYLDSSMSDDRSTATSADQANVQSPQTVKFKESIFAKTVQLLVTKPSYVSDIS
jgi:hypothetical protein